MKKRTMALMMAASFFGAAGCSAENVKLQKTETEPGKVLVAYYSWGRQHPFRRGADSETDRGNAL